MSIQPNSISSTEMFGESSISRVIKPSSIATGALFGLPRVTGVVSIERTLIEHLHADTSLSQLIGTKIYAGIIPQGTVLPACSFIATGGGPTHSLSGISHYQKRNYRFSVWAGKQDMQSLINISDIVENRLDGYRGNMGTKYPTTIQYIMLKNIYDFFEPDSETQQRVLEFEIAFTE